MKYKFIFFFFLFISNLHSQLVKKDSINNDIKLDNLPYYSYGKGIGLTSPDSLFQFNIRFRMQNRVTYYNDENNSYDALIRRLRLRFDGFVGNPKFLYVIQLSFAPNDVGILEEGEDINIIRDAALIYRPNKYWNFIFGQTKLPGNRQRINSSGTLQLTDRSINNSKFNIDRDFGFHINYSHVKKDGLSYLIKSAISTGEGRNFSSKNEDNIALTGKIELLPFGTFKNDGAFFEGDIAYESKPKIMLSAGYSQNNNSNKSQGQLGNLLYEKRTLQSTFIESVFKYKGFYHSFSYFTRNTTKDPITYNFAGEKSYVFVGSGMDNQISYIFNNKIEIIGRYSIQNPNKIIQLYEPNIKSYTIGVTKYIWEHAFKLQSELTYNQLDYFNNINKNNWYFRIQLEIGI